MKTIQTVQRFFVIVCIASAHSLSAATLFYDAPSGELFLDVVADGDNRMAGYDMKSASGKFLTEEYRRLGGATDLFQLRETGITEGGALVGGYAMGLYGLGPIYPTDVPQSDFEADVSGVWAILGESRTQSLDLGYGRPDGVPLNDPGIAQIDRWATNVTLTYLAPTGELILSNNGENGGFLTLFHLSGEFDPTNARDPGIGGRLITSTSEFTSLGLSAPGEYNLGALLPAGLDDAEFRQQVDRAIFAGQVGVGQSNIDLSTISDRMTLAYVPEPSGLTVAIVGILALLCSRSTREHLVS